MKKQTWIFVILIIVLFALSANLWQKNTVLSNNMEVMCKSSIYASREYFESFNTTKSESDYIAGVAEFRTYMTTYLCIADGVSDTDYTWCNILYGDMILNPKKVKEHIPELIEALEYLSEDYDHPNGFNLIHALNNQLKEE